MQRYLTFCWIQFLFDTKTYEYCSIWYETWPKGWKICFLFAIYNFGKYDAAYITYIQDLAFLQSIFEINYGGFVRKMSAKTMQLFIEYLKHR